MHAVGELILESFDRDRSPLAEGNSVVDAEPHEAFPCAGTEQWIVIGVRNDTEWQALCSVLPAPSLALDDRFIDALGRRRNRPALYAALSAVTRDWVKEDLAKRLQAAGVIAAPVCDGGDVARRADLWSAGFYQLLDHPSAGVRWYQGLPLRFGEDLVEADCAAPEFGQDNAYVAVQLLGRSVEEFDRLVADAVMTPVPAGLDRPSHGDEVLE
jgi:crotonobetainyl-CoA:carnitine CoA-transferase CaiB-like acyl-CoA transferase